MNILYYIIHEPLTLEYVDFSFKALTNQSVDYLWDNFIIYNAWDKKQLSNEAILQKYNEYELQKHFKSVEILPESDPNQKSLARDMYDIINHYNRTYLVQSSDKILILKAEYAICRNFMQTMTDFDNMENFIYTPNILNAKESVSDDEAFQKSQEIRCVLYNHETYYRGSDLYHPTHEIGPKINDRKIKDTDPEIKYVSHAIKRDFNVHCMPGDVFSKLDVLPVEMTKTWGGFGGFFRAFDRGVRFPNILNIFCVHKFHGVQSSIRKEDRGDKRKTIAGQRY